MQGVFDALVVTARGIDLLEAEPRSDAEASAQAALAHALDDEADPAARELLDVVLQRHGRMAPKVAGRALRALADDALEREEPKRLRELETSGLIERCELAAGASGYRLTTLGAALEPAIQELARWGGSHFMHGQPANERLSLGWMLLNLKRKAKPVKTPVAVEVSDLDDDRYTLSLGPNGLDVHAGVDAPSAAALRGDPLSIHRALFRGESVARLEKDGLLTVTGKRDAVRQLMNALHAAD